MDWTTNGIASLSLWIYGAEGNTGQLYVQDQRYAKVVNPGSVDIALAQWQPWTIDLSETGADLTTVTTLSIGIENVGEGVIYVDQITVDGLGL